MEINGTVFFQGKPSKLKIAMLGVVGVGMLPFALPLMSLKLFKKFCGHFKHMPREVYQIITQSYGLSNKIQM